MQSLHRSAGATSTIQTRLQTAAYSYVKKLGTSWLFRINITVTSYRNTVSPPLILWETKFVTNNRDVNKAFENIKHLICIFFKKITLLLQKQFSFPKKIWLSNPNTFIPLYIYIHLLLHTHTYIHFCVQNRKVLLV